jgi:streptogramin lyase
LKIIYILFILSIAYLGRINAQDYHAKTLTTENGLPSDQIYCSFEDSKGYIWITTKNGVARWDSKYFKYFTIKDGLPNNEIVGIYEDKLGRIWFYSFTKELSYYLNGKIYNPNIDNRLKNLNIGTRYGLYCDEDFMYYSDQKWKTHKVNVYTLIESGEYISSEFLPYVYGDSSTKIRFAVNNYANRLAVPIAQEGLIPMLKKIYSNHKLGDVIPKIVASGQPEDSLYNIAYNFRDSIIRSSYKASELLNSKNYTVVEFNNKLLYHNNEFKLVLNNANISKKLKKNILKLYLDKNQLHFLAQDKALYLFDPHKLKHKLDYRAALYNISKNGKKIYLAEYLNIHDLTDNLVIEKKHSANFAGYKYVFNNPSQNALFYGTTDGIYYDKNNTLTRLNDKRTYCLFIDSKNRLWYSTIEGLFLADHYLPKITEEKTLTLNPAFKVFVTDIKEDKLGRILIASNNGVYVYDKDVKNKYWLNDKNILSSNECNLIEIDPQDNSIWVSSFEGLNHFRIEEKDGKLKFILINRFFKDDGLYSNEIKDIQFQGDSLWIASSAGLNLLYDKNYKPPQINIPLHINQLWVNDQPIPVDTKLELSNKENNISLDYSAIYYERRDRLIVKYKLLRSGEFMGEKQLVDHKLNLLALENGNYSLELYAYDQDYPYIHSEKKTLHFTIKPPFYKTWWFWTGLIFGILAILAIYYYSIMIQRKNQLIEKVQIQNKFNELNLKSLRNQMNPHFVFNCLNSIKDFINKNDKISSNKFLTDFAKLIRTTLNITRKQYIYIEDEISYLRLYIQLEQMRFDNHFDFIIENRVPLEIYVELPSMMIQPFVENAIRHGQIGQLDYQGYLQIVFSLEGEYLVIHISDNGIGIVEAKKVSELKSAETQSLAIKILEEQIELIQKTYGQHISIDLEDRSVHNEKGTKVTLRIHIEEALQNKNN